MFLRIKPSTRFALSTIRSMWEILCLNVPPDKAKHPFCTVYSSVSVGIPGETIEDINPEIFGMWRSPEPVHAACIQFSLFFWSPSPVPPATLKGWIPYPTWFPMSRVWSVELSSSLSVVRYKAISSANTYIAQKESGFPKGRVSSRCNDVTTVTNTFSFGIFSTIYYKDRYNMLYRDIFSSKILMMQPNIYGTNIFWW